MPSGWQTASITGKPVDIFDPPNALPFALLFLHAECSATPVDYLTRELASRRIRCLTPRTGPSWWVDRVCREFDPHLTAERHLRENVVPWLESNWKLGKRSIAVAGLEMGGQGALRLGFKYPEQFPVVASVNGALDFHERYGLGTPLDEMYASREECRQDTAILHIPPHELQQIWFSCSPESPWYRGNDRLHEKLSALGIAHTALLDEVIDDERAIALMLGFVIAAIEREKLRLA